MNSAQPSLPRALGWKATVAASLLLVSLGLSSVSATPTTLMPDVRHKDGHLVSIQRLAGSTDMYIAANTDCASLGVTDCYDAVYDICSGSNCDSGCSCVIQHHSPNDAAPNHGQTGSCYDAQPGDYACSPFSGLSGDTYVKMNPYKVPDAQLIITRDQTCPPSGPNAVVASIYPDKGCVYVGTPEPSWGASAYPNGGSNFRRSFAENTLKEASLQKRSDCTMDVESQTDTYSTSKIVSETVDCRGKQSDCSIDVGKQHTETVTTTWSLSSGFDDFGFSVEASFGGSYATSDTSTKQDSITVNAGSEGYLTYYVEATRFEGTFRNCDQDGQKGTVYALKSDSNPAVVHYAVVNTNR